MKREVMANVKAHAKEYKNAKIYYHIMKKVIEEGKSFLKKERDARLKIINEVGVFHKKYSSYFVLYLYRYPMSKIYVNILNSFMRYDLSGLVALNGDNFDKIVNGKRSVLCVFYKKDCETCEAFKKEFISFFLLLVVFSLSFILCGSC